MSSRSPQDDPLKGPRPIPAERQTCHSPCPEPPGRPAEFTRLLKVAHDHVAAARSRGRLTDSERRAVVALLEAVRALVGDDDAP